MALLQSEPNNLLELSQAELLDISRWINCEFAPRFMTPMAKNPRALSFAAQELQSISAEISREFTPLTRSVTSSLILLPIDPQHIHAYWRIAERNPSVPTKINSDEEELTLRIFTQPQLSIESPAAKETADWFDIRINQAESRQDVELPANTDLCGTYSAVLGVQQGEQDFLPMLISNSITMPKSGGLASEPDHEKAVLSSALSQFIIPGAPASSPAGKSLC